MRILTILLIMFFCIGSFYEAGAELPEEYDTQRLCYAIFKAEGGYTAQYLYGIRSIPYKNMLDARKICINTIENNKERFYNQSKYGDYLDFLASRYCPIGAENDPQGLNRHWIKNVRYYYNK